MRDTLNILQLHWGFLVGGGSRYVQGLEHMARQHGISSHGLCILDPRWSADEEGLNRISHTRITTHGRLDRSWVSHIATQIRTRHPDMLMTHGFNAHFVAWLAQFFARPRIPVICSYHGPYHAVNLGTRFVGYIYDRFTERFLRCNALAVVTVAEHAKASLVRKGVPAEKITVIPNAIEDVAIDAAERPVWRQRWGVHDGEILIGAVGRLDPIKGQMHLVRAFNVVATQHPSARLVLVGDGPDRERIEEEVRKSKHAERIILAGRISNASEVLPAFDIYVLPSMSECHSIALLEAMRAALPVVATAVGGNIETINGEREGLLVLAGDPAAMGDAIARLIRDREFARDLGIASRQRFLRDFTQDLMLKKTAAWLGECRMKAG